MYEFGRLAPFTFGEEIIHITGYRSDHRGAHLGAPLIEDKVDFYLSSYTVLGAGENGRAVVAEQYSGLPEAFRIAPPEKRGHGSQPDDWRGGYFRPGAEDLTELLDQRGKTLTSRENEGQKRWDIIDNSLL